MTSDPFMFRCGGCGTPLDHLVDDFTVPPRYCPGGPCEAKAEARKARRRGWGRALIAVLSRPFVPYHNRYLPEVSPVTSPLRKSTPPRRQPNGQLITVDKRSCNGCGIELGDVTPDEHRAMLNGDDLPDVRGECLSCSALVQIAGVALGDEVLYRLQSTSEWMRGTVSAISPEDAALRIVLADRTEAVEVRHGFGLHEWCTLDELVEHRKVNAREVTSDAS